MAWLTADLMSCLPRWAASRIMAWREAKESHRRALIKRDIAYAVFKTFSDQKLYAEHHLFFVQDGYGNRSCRIMSTDDFEAKHHRGLKISRLRWEAHAELPDFACIIDRSVPVLHAPRGAPVLRLVKSDDGEPA